MCLLYTSFFLFEFFSCFPLLNSICFTINIYLKLHHHLRNFLLFLFVQEIINLNSLKLHYKCKPMLTQYYYVESMICQVKPMFPSIFKSLFQKPLIIFVRIFQKAYFISFSDAILINLYWKSSCL